MAKAKGSEKRAAAIADLTRSWSDGYRAGLGDGIRWVLEQISAGASRAEVLDGARRRFTGAGDSLDRYWNGRTKEYPPTDGPDELAEDFRCNPTPKP